MRMPRFTLRDLPAGLLVLLAMISQLAMGGIIVPDAPITRVMVMCRAGVVDQPARKPVPQRRLTSAVLPLSAALAVPGVVLSPFVAVPLAPCALIGRCIGAVGARAPPVLVAFAHFPRGPPILI